MLKVYDSTFEGWNDIVKSFKDYDVYYLKDYCNSFKINGDGEPLLFLFENDNLKAINVVFKRDIGLSEKLKNKIEKNVYYDLSTPYGYGGWIYEGNYSDDDVYLLDRVYTDYCIEKNIVSEFVRLHPLLKNYRYLDKTYDIKEIGPTISIKLDNMTNIWDNYSSKNRNKIRKAKKDDVRIYWGRNPELLKDFVRLYEQNMLYDNADNYYYFSNDFYNSLMHDLRYNFLFFYAVKDGSIISMTIILFANGKIHYHLSGADIEKRKYAPNNLMLHEVIKWASFNDFKLFHMGGGLGGAQDSLYKFKKSFNKEDSTYFYLGKKIFSREIYNQLSKLSDSDSFTDYFPIYRR